QRPDLFMLACAKTFGDVRRGGEHYASCQQEDRHPDRIAQCYGGEIMGADAPGHDGIDEAHGSVGQLRDHLGQGEGEEGTQLTAYPPESLLSRHFRGSELYTRSALVYARRSAPGRRIAREEV